MSQFDFVKNLIASGDRQRGINELTKILQTNRHNTEAWLLLAQIIGDTDRERDCYNQILIYDHHNPQALEGLRLLDIYFNESSSFASEILPPDIHQESNPEKPSSIINGEDESIALVCPQCGKINNPQSKMCVQCYYPLAFAARMRNQTTNSAIPSTQDIADSKIRNVSSEKNANSSNSEDSFNNGKGIWRIAGIIILGILGFFGISYVLGSMLTSSDSSSENNPLGMGMLCTIIIIIVGFFILSKNSNTSLNSWSNNVPKCPTCSSTNIQRISTASKVGKVAVFGIFAIGAVGKTFKCNNCGYKW